MFLSLCGQTLNNDGLLSVWFNDEDCLAYVRWLGQSHRIAHQLSPKVDPLDTATGQNEHWAQFMLCHH